MSVYSHWLLTVLLFVPLVGAVPLLFVRKPAGRFWTAVGTTSLAFFTSLMILLPAWSSQQESSQNTTAGVMLRHQSGHAVEVGGNYLLAIDGLSFSPIVLTTLLFIAACAVSRELSSEPVAYFPTLLLFEFSVLGTLLSFDLRLFSAFSALLVVAACLLSARWGGAHGRKAAAKMLILLGFGLLCLLVVVIGTAVVSRHALGEGAFNLVRLSGPEMRRMYATPAWSATGRVLFVFALLAFAVQLPVFPFRAWFTDVVSELRPPVAMILGNLLPITGGYGLLRIAGPLFPGAAESLWALPVTLALVSIGYCSLCAAGQNQTSRWMAFVAGSFAGFVMLGFAVRTAVGADGAVLALASGALTVAALLALNGRSAAQKSEGAAPSTNDGASLAAGSMLWLVLPGLLSQMIVLIGIFQAAQPDSILRAGGSARAATIYIVAALACVMVLLTGIAVSRFIQTRFAAPQSGAGSPAAAEHGDIGIGSALALVAVLIGILPTPLCLYFTHRAVLALLQQGG